MARRTRRLRKGSSSRTMGTPLITGFSKVSTFSQNGIIYIRFKITGKFLNHIILHDFPDIGKGLVLRTSTVWNNQPYQNAWYAMDIRSVSTNEIVADLAYQGGSGAFSHFQINGFHNAMAGSGFGGQIATTLAMPIVIKLQK